MTSKPQLLINADDYGLTPGVTQGILTLLASGKISNTTAMMCVPGSVELQSKFRVDVDTRRIGVHLQLTSGEPVRRRTKSSLVVPGTSEFRSKADFALLDPEDVYCEWMGQVELFVSLYGHRPSHLDSHHGPHQWEHLLPVYCAVAKHFDLPVRGGSVKTRAVLAEHGVEHCDLICDTWTGKGSSKALLLAELAELLRGEDARTVEVVSHPGFVDRDLIERSSLSSPREKEFRELAAVEASDLSDLGVTLFSYRGRG